MHSIYNKVGKVISENKMGKLFFLPKLQCWIVSYIIDILDPFLPCCLTLIYTVHFPFRNQRQFATSMCWASPVDLILKLHKQRQSLSNLVFVLFLEA